MVIWRICSYMKLVLENLKDYRLKNSKAAIFILKYSIVLSFFIILLGSYIIFSSFDRTLSNTVLIQPIFENQGYIYVRPPNSVYGTSYLFDPRNESPIYDIRIGVEYKEPLACGDSLKINGIEMLIKPIVVKDVNLDVFLYGLGSPSHVLNLDPKRGVNTSRITISYAYNNGTLISEFRTLAFDKYNGDLIMSGQKSYENFEFFYALNYSLFGDFENKYYLISGNATPEYPIRCMDYVTETNVSINKSLLRLTGILIILDSFPFVTSLKRLIEKEKR